MAKTRSAARASFSEIALFWSTATGPLADALNSIPKIAFSRKGFDAPKTTGASKSWTESLVLTGDLSEEIAKLKQQLGKILVAHGGTSFAQSLVHTGLIDEFWFAIHPIVLGRGFHLISELKSPLDLKLESSVSFEAGTQAKVYRVG